MNKEKKARKNNPFITCVQLQNSITLKLLPQSRNIINVQLSIVKESQNFRSLYGHVFWKHDPLLAICLKMSHPVYIEYFDPTILSFDNPL